MQIKDIEISFILNIDIMIFIYGLYNTFILFYI